MNNGSHETGDQNYIFTQSLDMNDLKGRELVSLDSKITCKDLQTLTC